MSLSLSDAPLKRGQHANGLARRKLADRARANHLQNPSEIIPVAAQGFDQARGLIAGDRCGVRHITFAVDAMGALPVNRSAAATGAAAA